MNVDFVRGRVVHNLLCKIKVALTVSQAHQYICMISEYVMGTYATSKNVC